MNPITLNPAASLNSARGDLQKNLRTQESKIVDTAKEIQNAFNRAQEPVTEANTTEAPRNEDTISISAQAAVVEEVTAQNEESVIGAVVDLKEASNSYLASLKALDAVNDLEKEAIDILK